MAHVIIESAQGPNPSFFSVYPTFIRLGGLLGPGFGPGLDNFKDGLNSNYMMLSSIYSLFGGGTTYSIALHLYVADTSSTRSRTSR